GSGWTNTTGSPAVAVPAAGTFARFHSYAANINGTGYIDYYLNFSPTGTKELKFDYRNQGGTDNLLIQISTDGGASFTNVGTAYGTNTAWTTQTISSISTSVSTTVVVRFLATSDYTTGGDIGIDNVRCCVVPTISTQPSTTAQTVCQNGTTTQLSITAANASGYQWYSNTLASNTGGTLIPTATLNTYTPPSGTVGTSYYYCIVTNACGTTVTSSVSGAVTVNGNPTSLISGTSSSICLGSSASLTGSATFPFSGATSTPLTYSLTTSGGLYPGEKWVNITTGVNGTGTVVWAQGNGTIGNGSGLLTNQAINLSAYAGQTLYLNCYDQYDDTWDGSTYTLSLNGTTQINNGGNSPTDGADSDATSSWDASAAELETSEALW
ncbi:MAG: choice-of-anchor J domain-containing protein, partial [Bacteroidota bacterium]